VLITFILVIGLFRTCQSANCEKQGLRWPPKVGLNLPVNIKGEYIGNLLGRTIQVTVVDRRCAPPTVLGVKCNNIKPQGDAR